MKVLKIVLGIIVAIVAIFLIIGLFQPTDFNYERYTVVEAPKKAVFANISNLPTWEKWNPWSEKDPTMKMVFGEQKEGVGASYSWTSENSGNGSLTIAESNPPESMKTDLVFDGQEGGNGYWTLQDDEGGATKVIWGMGFKMPYPMNAMSIFMNSKEMEKEINEMFDLGLANLKKLTEDAAKTVSGYDVQTVDFPGRKMIMYREKIEIAKIVDFYTQHFGAIFGAVMGEKEAEMDGMPCGLFYEWDEENNMTDMAAGIGLKGDVMVEGYENTELPAGKALLIDYYGPYDGSGKAHYAMDDYIKANNLKVKSPVVEEYVTDPSTQPDTSKWLTRVYYFLEM